MIHRGYSKYLRYLLLWNDIIILNIINILISYSVDESIDFFNSSFWLKFFIFYNLVWIIIAFINPPSNIIGARKLKFSVLLRSILLNVVIHGSLIFSYIIYFRQLSLNSFVAGYSSFIIAIVFSRTALLIALKWYRKKGYNYRNIILIKHNNSQSSFQKLLERDTDLGYRIKKIYNPDFLKSYKNDKGNFKSIIKNEEIDEAFIDPIEINSRELNDLVNFFEDRFIKVRILSDLGLQLNRKMKSNHYGNFWFLDISPIPMDKLVNRLIKRVFDIIFSLIIVLLIISWVFPIISMIILIESGSPIYFKQLRSGEKNKEFGCLKFRTMRVNNESDNIQSFKNDPRITKFGKFLRKTSIDELPQFFNVLKGEMSVVGPRPHMLKHTQEYSNIVDRYFQRHHVKPGITGLAQIKGFRGEINNTYDINGRINFDKSYIENWSLLYDLKIISYTVVQILIPLEKAH